jgi:Zn-dependent M28 family amino/carboxypeptidase
MALTAEEKGTLGSQWYVKHPLVPLNKTILNFNSDGVGYNDISMITSISLGRTNMDGFLTQAARRFNFTLGGDPDVREGFYERSDQVSFAKVGIPAIKLQPGLSEMNDEILRYYHRAQDEVESMDLDYITRFYRAFVYAAYLITNDSLKPAWVQGDKFEAEYKKLYQE